MTHRMLRGPVAVLVCAWIALSTWTETAAPENGLVSVRGLVSRLARVGRAEARVTRTQADALTGTSHSLRGNLSLEAPDRARLDFTRTGERVTVRGDGGEWLQPQTRQLLILGPEQAAAAARAWQIFLHGNTEPYRERSLGTRRYRLIPRRSESTPLDSADVTLGADGLPTSLVAYSGGVDEVRYQFGAWRFLPPRGAEAFTLRAPPGYAVVQLR